MKHHGYLFTAEMVLAILAETKTETRRPVTWANSLIDGTGKGIREAWKHLDWSRAEPGDGCFVIGMNKITPRVQPGDLAYVKETWQLMRHLDPYRFSKAWDVESKNGVVPLAVRYDADGKVRDPRNIRGLLSGWKWGKTRSSMLMPKDASRAWLPVVSVGAGFVQDITEAEAIAEGTRDYPTEDEDPLEEPDWSLCPKCGGTLLYNDCGPCFGVRFDNDCHECDTYVKRFKYLWTSIHGDEGPKSWAANPPLWIPRWKEVRDRP